MSSGWTYHVSSPWPADMVRIKLAEAWQGEVAGDRVRVSPSMTVAVETDPFEGYDFAIDFYGPADQVPALAAQLPRLFTSVSEPVWA